MKRYLWSQGVYVYDNPDQYGIDLIGYIPHGIDLIEYIPHGFDVEVKEGWTDFKFPFDSLHIPVRKAKWTSSQSFFAVLNVPMTRMAVVKGSDLKECIQKDTIYTTGEEFFEIPLSKVDFRRLH